MNNQSTSMRENDASWDFADPETGCVPGNSPGRRLAYAIADAAISALGPPETWVYSRPARRAMGLNDALGDAIAQHVIDWVY